MTSARDERPPPDVLAAVGEACTVVSNWIDDHAWEPRGTTHVDYDAPAVVLYATEPLPDDARAEIDARLPSGVALVEVRCAYTERQMGAEARRLLQANIDGPFALSMAGSASDGNGVQVWPRDPVGDEAALREHLAATMPLTVREAVGPVYPTGSG
jgi:hypothetical protein